MTLALLHTLRDIGIGLCVVGTVAFALWLEGRRERIHKARVEREDLEDFAAYVAGLYTRDWEFPPTWKPPAKEYVAKPKGKVR